jgi:putative chitinase
MDAKTLMLAAGVSDAMAQTWATPITTAMREFGIDTPARQAAFIPQIAHESRGFSRLRESLDYTPKALLDTFGRSRISAEAAARLGRQAGEPMVPTNRQMAIANMIYGGRYGNNTAGDGWRYRGGGLMQITFLANYADGRDAIGEDIVTAPERVAEPMIAARLAGWFWKTRRCNDYADTGDFVGLTKRINPAMNGLDKRTALWEVAKHALGVK